MTHQGKAQKSVLVPPIVLLLIRDDAAALETCAASLEARGMWVLRAADADQALRAVSELRPDVIVVDADQRTPFTDCGIPVLALTDVCPDPPGVAATEPRVIRPSGDALVREIQAVIGRPIVGASRRRPSDAVAPLNPEVSMARRCPKCDTLLSWIETGSIEGILYDYYHWCDRGCGLFCYDRQAGRFVELA